MGYEGGRDMLTKLKQGRKDRIARVLTKNLVAAVEKDIDVRYGHNLNHEGVNIKDGAISPCYAYEDVVNTTKGSMIVGTNGLFLTSTVLEILLS